MNKYRIVVPILLLVCSVCLTGCKSKKSNEEKGKTEANTPITPPDFNADSAFAYVKAQLDFGPRTMGSQAHDNCRDYLLRKLGEFCDTAFTQDFTVRTYDDKSWPASNIIGSFDVANPNRVVLSAHWDARPFADHDPHPANRDKAIDGANDGASGVGVLLEVARQLRQLNPNVGVDIVLFDAEDYGPKEGETAPKGDWWCLGSQYWAQNLHTPNYTARFGILLDMVGPANPCFMQESFSVRDAQPVVAKVWGTAYELGYGNVFINSPGGIITDDHYYVNKYTDIPMIDIIHYDAYTGTGFGSFWHTMNDNIQSIDKNSLDMVGKTVLQVIKNEQ